MCLDCKVQREAISKTIVERITDALIAGELKPGDRLPTEVDIAQMMGVGRNSVREAVKIMEAFGVVEIRRADGIYIAEEYRSPILEPLVYGLLFDMQTESNILSFRFAYLQMAVYLGMEKYTKEDIFILKDSVAKMEKEAGLANYSVEEIYNSFRKIEKTVMEACNNPLVVDFADVLERLSKGILLCRFYKSIRDNTMNQGLQIAADLIDLIDKKDHVEVINLFNRVKDMCDFNKKTSRDSDNMTIE